MKRILAVLSACFVAAAAGRADVIYNETFNYIDGISYVVGTNNGVTNWFAHSGATGNDSFIRGKKLQVGMNRQADVNRPLTAAYTLGPTNLFASFTVVCTNLPTTTNYFAHFQVNATTFHCRLWNSPGSLPGTWRLGVTTASTTLGLIKYFPVDLATNVDYQVVLNWDASLGSALAVANLWVNPTSSAEPAIQSGDGTTAATITAFGFRQPGGANGANNFEITNLVVATTFDEATTNVWSATPYAPTVIYNPQSQTNFPGAPVSLFAVVSGQSPNTLTYSWFKDGAPYDDPNASPDNNVLTFPSSQVSDSGNYQLVVTSGNGLSATSTVANLWITNAPIPAIILKHPTNTTVYAGQSATLTVSAIGPGTLAYTWFKGVNPVSGSIGVDGPTLVIANVQSNNNTTGTYYCRVDNDYGNTPSSNATVSVATIPTVSVAFLRTLVDTTTYLATNSTSVYQVIGTVTTATNLTTGNTASYYLQDGTAGINIFATFASTFRPAQGDVVSFVGVLSSFNSTLELLADSVNNPASSYTILSNNIPGLPEPKVIAFNITNNLAFCETNLEGRIVMLTNVFFGTNAGTALSTTANAFITVTNAGGETFTLNFSSVDLDTAGQTLPEFATSIVGPFSQNLNNTTLPRNSAYQVIVTRFSDIVTNPLALTQAGPGQLTWPAASLSYPYTVSAATSVTGPYVTISNKLRSATGTGTLNDPNPTGTQKFYRLSTP